MASDHVVGGMGSLIFELEIEVELCYCVAVLFGIEVGFLRLGIVELLSMNLIIM